MCFFGFHLFNSLLWTQILFRDSMKSIWSTCLAYFSILQPLLICPMIGNVHWDPSNGNLANSICKMNKKIYVENENTFRYWKFWFIDQNLFIIFCFRIGGTSNVFLEFMFTISNQSNYSTLSWQTTTTIGAAATTMKMIWFILFELKMFYEAWHLFCLVKII